MDRTMEASTFARGPMIAITVMRVLVGWHFFYEGLSKLTAPSWSAAGFFKAAKGPIAGSLQALAAQPDQLGHRQRHVALRQINHHVRGCPAGHAADQNHPGGQIRRHLEQFRQRPGRHRP